MVLIHQNKRAKIILHAKSPTFWAAKLKGFTVNPFNLAAQKVGDLACKIILAPLFW